MIRLIAALALAALPAVADPLGLVDYDALFAQHADRVVTSTDGQQVLDLPPSTRITRMTGDSSTVVGIDLSEGGAPGCIAAILVDVAALLRACPDSFTDAQRGAVETHADRLSRFYAANVLPQVTPEAARLRFDARVADRAADWTGRPDWSAAACIADPENAPLLDTVTSNGFRNILESVLAVPRLPVSNPCL